MMLEKLTRT